MNKVSTKLTAACFSLGLLATVSAAQAAFNGGSKVAANGPMSNPNTGPNGAYGTNATNGGTSASGAVSATHRHHNKNSSKHRGAVQNSQTGTGTTGQGPGGGKGGH